MGENSWNGFERNCLFARRSDGRYVDVGRVAGADPQRDARGVATADLNGDGRLDLVIANNGAEPTVLLNTLHTGAHWLGLELEAARGNPDAVGAEVRLTGGGETLTRVVAAGSGYASQSSLVLHFGLAESAPEALSIRWPSGAKEELSGRALRELVTLDGVTRLVEDRGALVTADRNRTMDDGGEDAS